MKIFITTLIFTLLLSFTVLAQKKKTERERDGLKGAVKSVLTKKTSILQVPRKTIYSNPVIESETIYSKDGDWLFKKIYDDLNKSLYRLMAYGFVDGERVYTHINAENQDEIAAVLAEDNNAEKKSGSKYTNTIKYKYNKKGELIEETITQIKTGIVFKTVFKYKIDQIEELLSALMPMPLVKSVHKLDKEGNIIETFFYDPETKKINGKVTYKHSEFDSNGNWTKRITSESDESNLKIMNESEIHHREITYY